MKIAIAICTCNRPHALSTALQSCLDQVTVPCQVLVIDDGDLPESLIEQWRDAFSQRQIDFTYARKPAGNQGLTRSRNLAMRLTAAEIILYIDDDTQLGPDCLAQLHSVVTADRTCALAGVDFVVVDTARAQPGRRLIERMYQLAGLWCLTTRFRRSPKLPRELNDLRCLTAVPYLQGMAMAIRRATLDEIGGFDQSLARYALGEDKDISIRLARKGILARITSCTIVHSSDPSSRTDPAELGSQTVGNYIRINSKNYRLAVGEILLIGYTILSLILIESLFACWGDRAYHLQQLRGMANALLALAWGRVTGTARTDT